MRDEPLPPGSHPAEYLAARRHSPTAVDRDDWHRTVRLIRTTDALNSWEFHPAWSVGCFRPILIGGFATDELAAVGAIRAHDCVRHRLKLSLSMSIPVEKSSPVTGHVNTMAPTDATPFNSVWLLNLGQTFVANGSHIALYVCTAGAWPCIGESFLYPDTPPTLTNWLAAIFACLQAQPRYVADETRQSARPNVPASSEIGEWKKSRRRSTFIRHRSLIRCASQRLL